MFEVKVSPQAAEDLLEIKDYIENADMILYGGCESSEIQSVVTLLLVDVKELLQIGFHLIHNHHKVSYLHFQCNL